MHNYFASARHFSTISSHFYTRLSQKLCRISQIFGGIKQTAYLCIVEKIERKIKACRNLLNPCEVRLTNETQLFKVYEK